MAHSTEDTDTLNTDPRDYDWADAHNVRHYYSTDEQPVEQSATLTYGTTFIADYELMEEPREIKGWPDSYMAKARVVTGRGENICHLGCDEDGTPTRIVHGTPTNKDF